MQAVNGRGKNSKETKNEKEGTITEAAVAATQGPRPFHPWRKELAWLGGRTWDVTQCVSVCKFELFFFFFSFHFSVFLGEPGFFFSGKRGRRVNGVLPLNLSALIPAPSLNHQQPRHKILIFNAAAWRVFDTRRSSQATDLHRGLLLLLLWCFFPHTFCVLRRRRSSAYISQPVRGINKNLFFFSFNKKNNTRRAAQHSCQNRTCILTDNAIQRPSEVSLPRN